MSHCSRETRQAQNTVSQSVPPLGLRFTREKRRKYLVAEREMYCSIANQSRDAPEERLKYGQLKALNKYHRHNGVEAVLRRNTRSADSRPKEGLWPKSPHTITSALLPREASSVQSDPFHAGSDRTGLQDMWDREGRNRVSCQNGTSAHDL